MKGACRLRHLRSGSASLGARTWSDSIPLLPYILKFAECERSFRIRHVERGGDDRA